MSNIEGIKLNGTVLEIKTGSNVDIHIEDDTLVINTDGTSSGGSSGISGSTSKEYACSGVPVHLGDNLIQHLCGVEITDTEIINEIQKVINTEKIVQVYYGGGYDISKSSYLFTSAINFFMMDIITTGTLALSGPGVAIMCINNKYYYCDTDFWNLNDGVPISKTINLTFKFMDISGEVSSGNGVGTVDTSMSDSSTNPVQNKVIKAYVDTAIASAIGSKLEGEY